MASSRPDPVAYSPNQSDKSDIDENLWPSPVKSKSDSVRPQEATQKFGRSEDRKETSSYKMPSAKGVSDDGTAKDDTLRLELQGVRKVNEAIEGAIESLAKAKGSMQTVNATVAAASSLLSTWTKILSQTEHNKRLILNPNWQGASQDMADADEEAATKQQAADRREQEEQERQAAAARQAEDEGRRREEAVMRDARGASRGKFGSSRGLNRGGSARPTSTGSYGGTYGSARGPSSGRHMTSGTGKGSRTGSVRGRGRG